MTSKCAQCSHRAATCPSKPRPWPGSTLQSAAGPRAAFETALPPIRRDPSIPCSSGLTQLLGAAFGEHHTDKVCGRGPTKLDTVGLSPIYDRR